MGFRFRRSLRLSPGVRLNVTQRGLSSLSVGRAGRSFNFGRRGFTTTVGIPGSGLSYSARNGEAVTGLLLVGALVGAFRAVRWLFRVVAAACTGNRRAQLLLVGVVVVLATIWVVAAVTRPGDATPPAKHSARP